MLRISVWTFHSRIHVCKYVEIMPTLWPRAAMYANSCMPSKWWVSKYLDKGHNSPRRLVPGSANDCAGFSYILSTNKCNQDKHYQWDQKYNEPKEAKLKQCNDSLMMISLYTSWGNWLPLTVNWLLFWTCEERKQENSPLKSKKGVSAIGTYLGNCAHFFSLKIWVNLLLMVVEMCDPHTTQAALYLWSTSQSVQ